MTLNQEKLSRAKNAKDITMNRTKPVILSAAKNLVSRRSHGTKEDSSLSLRMTTVGGFTLTAIAATLLLTVQPARAQVDADCTGSNPGSVNCAGPTFANGITHATNGGNLTVNSANGVTSYGTGGFVTTATGSDSITMTKGTGNLSNNATTGTRAPVVVGATAEAGDISITTGTGTVQGAAAFVQYGVRALTGTGDIALNLGGVVSTSTATNGVAAVQAVASGAGNISIQANGLVLNGAAGSLALDARSGGGDISITAAADIGNQNGTLANPTGLRELRGLLAQTTGAGNIMINTGVASIQSSGFNSTSLEARTGTGDIDITANVLTRGGIAIVTQTDGLATINLLNGIQGARRNTTRHAAYAVRSFGAGNVVVNVAGRPDQDLFQVGEGLAGFSSITAPFDFRNLGGAARLNFEVGTAWLLTDPASVELDAADLSILSAGNDVVDIADGAVLSTSAMDRGGFGSLGWNGFASNLGLAAERYRYRLQFGDGDDLVTMAGWLFVAPLVDPIVGGNDFRGAFPGEMRLEGLETFRNSGEIWLGAMFGNVGAGNKGSAFSGRTDNRADDILSLPGAHFIGETDADGQALGKIFADVNIGVIGQSGCGIEQRGDDNSLPVADCLDLRDGRASGRTNVVIVQRTPGDRGAYNPDGSVLVDVRGAGAAETDPLAFGISPDSFQYGELGDGTGIIDKGLFFYTIQYDAEDEQYKIYGLPGDGAQQFPLLTTAANRLWQRAAGAWFERQVDQRDLAKGTEVGTGLWFRSSVASTDRDLTTPITAGIAVLDFDNSYTQDDVTTSFGWDWIGRSNEEGSLIAGVMLGYARAKLKYDNGPNTANLEGMHAGLYGSVTQGGFYLDAAIAQTWLDITNDIPALNLTPATAILDTRGKSLGGRLEGGWRIPIGPVQIEPLAGLSWVKTTLDDMRVPAGDETRIGGDLRFKGVSNNNVSYGLRVAMDNLMASVMPLGVSLTARQIEEIHGRSEVVINNIGPIPATTADELDGTFTQLTGSVSLSNVKRTLAGYLNVDSLSGNDVSSLGFSAGVRYEW